MRCCGNCEWVISPELEDEIMEEQGYEEEDINRPKAGDCCIGMCPNKDYVCKEHEYIDGILNNEVLYDNQYMGPGILLMTTCDDELVRFMKMVTMGGSVFPVLRIRAFEQNEFGIDINEKFHPVEFSVSDDERLYESFSYLAKNIGEKTIKSILPIYEKNNNLQTRFGNHEAAIIINQNTCGNKFVNDYVELTLGDNLTCNEYGYFFTFYKMLNDLVERQATKNDIQRLILKK